MTLMMPRPTAQVPRWIHAGLILISFCGRYGVCTLREHPTIRGRYIDEMYVNVMAGNDAILNYSYPSPVLPIQYITVDKKGGGYLGSCDTESVRDPCNRTTQYVRFITDDSGIHIVIPTVSLSHTGEYIIRATRNEDKQVDPNLIDLSVHMTVFEGDWLRIGFKVPNVFDYQYFSALDENPYISNVTSIFEVGHQYTISLLFHKEAPLANATIIQQIGNQTRHFHRTNIREGWSPTVVFNTSKSSEWLVHIFVEFDIQEVRPAIAEFYIEEMVHPLEIDEEAKSLSSGYIALIVIAITVIAAIVVVLIVREHRKMPRKPSLEDLADVPRLSGYEVKKENLTVPEYMFEMNVPDSHPSSSRYRDLLVDCIKILSALANTSGGVVICHVKSNKRTLWIKKSRRFFDQFSKTPFESLIKTSKKENLVVFFVKKSRPLIFMHQGSDVQKYSYKKTAPNLLDMFPELTGNPSRLYTFWSLLTKRTSISPERYVYFEYQKSLETFVRTKKEMRDIVLLYAKSNCGGVIVLVQDQPSKQPDEIPMNDYITENPEDILQKFYDECLEPDSTSNQSPFMSQHVKRFEAGNKNFVVWFINGGPVVYGISEDGDVERISLRDVDTRFNTYQSDGNKQLNAENTGHVAVNMENTEQFPVGAASETDQLLKNDESIQSDNEPEKKLQYPATRRRERTREEEQRNNHWYREDTMRTATSQAIQCEVLSWSKNSFVWKSSQDGQNGHQKSFELDKPVSMVPSLDTILSFAHSHNRDDTRNQLKKIRANFKKKGCIIYLRSSCCIEILQLREDEDPVIQHITPSTDDEHGTRSNAQGKKVQDNKHAQIAYEENRVCKKQIYESMNSHLTEEVISFIIPTTYKTDSAHHTASWYEDYIKSLSLKFHEKSEKEQLCKAVNNVLYNLVVSKNASVRYRLGDKRLAQLAREKFRELKIQDAFEFHFFEGPPGSGKSLIAQSIYEEESSANKAVLYCCPSEGFKAFLQSIGVKDAKVIPDKESLRNLTIYIDDYDVIIVDDVQRFEFVGAEEWKQLCEKVHNKGKTLYLFIDSKYQNYHTTSCIEEVLQVLEEKWPSTLNRVTLTDVHRNAKKVFSFIRENMPGVTDILDCPHREYGDDVLLCHLPDAMSDTPSNGLVHLVKGLIGQEVEARKYIHDVPYAAAEIAIIIGGKRAKEDKDYIMKLFEEHAEIIKVHDTTIYPREGVVVETADEFCGLDSPVCIFYPGTDTSGERNINNPAFKTYIASRGINLVIFVDESKEFNLKHADDMQMSKLGKNIINNYSHWHKADVFVTLQCVQHAVDDGDILSGLSAITTHYGKEEQARIFVENDGIDYALRRITKSDNREIRERALITLTAAALHDSTFSKLMRNDVIQAACKCLKEGWDPEWWEAAYLLGHLLHKGADSWVGREPPKAKIIERLTTCLCDDHGEEWTKQRESAVAHGADDYKAYKDWIEQTELPILRLLSMMSLSNLIQSEGDNECPNLDKHIGIENIHSIIGNASYDEKIRKLASDIVKAFDEKKIVHKWERYY